MNLSVNCNFSYGHYKETLEKIKETHDISTFGNTSDKDVILRHDIDASLEAALKIAELENKVERSETAIIAQLFNHGLISQDEYESIRDW